MEWMNGEDFLLGMMNIHKKAEDAPGAIKEHDLPKGHWRRVIDPDGEAPANPHLVSINLEKQGTIQGISAGIPT